MATSQNQKSESGTGSGMYMVPCIKTEDDRYFVGGITEPENCTDGSFYDHISKYFPMVNVKRIESNEDLAEKFEKERVKVEKAKIRLESDVGEKLKTNELWSFMEVEEWLNRHVISPSNEGAKVANIFEVSKISDQTPMEDEDNDQKSEQTDKSVKVKIKDRVYELDEIFLSECIDALDLNDADERLTKEQLAKFGLKLLPLLIQENKSLKDQIKQQNLQIKANRDEIEKLNKESFAVNTKTILTRNEAEKEIVASQSASYFNKIILKLEDLGKGQSRLAEKQSSGQLEIENTVKEIKVNTNTTKINTDRAVDILGGIQKDLKRDKFVTGCKIKTMQEIEGAQASITLFGSSQSMKSLLDTAHEDLRRDLESLKRKKILMLQTTEKTGLENLLQLIKENTEKGTMAAIVLNIAAETAEMLLNDENYSASFTIPAKVIVKELVSSAKENFNRVVFVVPPHTPKSHSFIKTFAAMLQDEGDKVEVLNLSQVQKEMAKNCPKEDTWLLETERSLKMFTIVDDEACEGWNHYASKVMVTHLSSMVSVNKTSVECCLKCGLGHHKNSICPEEDKITPGGYNKGTSEHTHDLAEECLKCFKGNHSTESCTVGEWVRCRYEGCFRQGHLRAIHFPKKKETVERLYKKYGTDFAVIHSGKRDINREVPRTVKRSKKEQTDRSY